MAAVGRVLLWAVVLVAPGGFLLVPVLAAASLGSRSEQPLTLRERAAELFGAARSRLAQLQSYWTKS
jgi:hypothetical protein